MIPQFKNLTPPAEGTPITKKDGSLVVPHDPIIPFVEGDGIGPDIWRASVRVFDAAVKKAYDGQRRVVWFEVLAGAKAKEKTGEWLPTDTLEAAKAYRVAIKGPLTTLLKQSGRTVDTSVQESGDGIGISGARRSASCRVV